MYVRKYILTISILDSLFIRDIYFVLSHRKLTGTIDKRS